MLNIKAISFDLDDTLWECGPVIQRAEDSLLSFLQQRCDRIKSRYDSDSYNQKKKEFTSLNRHLSGDVTRMRIALLTEMLQDSDDKDNLLTEAFAHFYEIRSDVEFYPDALKSLQILADKYPLAALTNGNADLFRIGITHLFEKIICASLEHPAKPHPYMFEQTCQEFAIQPEELLHVGDNPQTDVEGARRAGVRTVWINRNAEQWNDDYEPADHEVCDLHELLQLLKLNVSS